MNTENEKLKKNCCWPYYTIKEVPSYAQDNAPQILILVAECVAANPHHYHQYIKENNGDLICPKLDNTDECIQKIVQLIKKNSLEKIILIRVELKCCQFLTEIVKRAVHEAGQGQQITIIERIVK